MTTTTAAPHGLPPLGWLGIVRLGLVQAALGAVVVLTTSTLNRVMVVEIGLWAMVPGLLVGLHHSLQMLRPRLGYGSDMGGRRTPWIVGGMAVLAGGGFVAALATAWMSTSPAAGIALAVVGFFMIGVGSGACGTTLLVLMSKRAAPQHRAAAATITWVLMIVGFIVTTIVAGSLLDPYTPARLVAISGGVSAAAMVLTLLAVWGVEGRGEHGAGTDDTPRDTPPFLAALKQVWAEPQARGFAIFVFVSMLAYSAQDLILEPYAGLVFGMTPGETTKLTSVQYQGALLGMILVGVAGSWLRRDSLRAWTIGGCAGSCLALLLLALGGLVGPGYPIVPTVFFLGFANGCFAIGAIGSMMERVAVGRAQREGVRMGLWGAAQAVAMGIGQFAGTVAADAARQVFDTPALAYGSVFVGEGLLFLTAALMASRMDLTGALTAGRRLNGDGRTITRPQQALKQALKEA